MSEANRSIHGQWSSRLAFILAATGSAVGLGNIWKFPYITGEYGGGAFVLVYLLCITAIGLPIMIAEVMLGRRGRQSPINTMAALAKQTRQSQYWSLLGWLGVVTGFLILSFYSVIAGWAMAYVFRSGGGQFIGADAAAIGSMFTDLISDPERLLAWHSIFSVLTVLIVSRGVAGGLEKAVRFLMPVLFLLLLMLVGYAVVEGDFAQGLRFLFMPDFSKLSGEAVLIAMGHAFFTLSLGMGAIMIYGSYLPSGVSIVKVSIAVALADTVVALLAGLAIFPIVFANGLEPASGPGLVFTTLPLAFSSMPGGVFFGTAFFIMLVFAALSSAISLIEPAVAWLVENRGMGRVFASSMVGFATWFIGVGTVLSFNLWSDPLPYIDKNFFDALDYLTANILLPLGGLLIAVFAGWLMSSQMTRSELAAHETVFNVWKILIRFVAPIAVIIVFLNAIGVFKS